MESEVTQDIETAKWNYIYVLNIEKIKYHFHQASSYV